MARPVADGASQKRVRRLLASLGLVLVAAAVAAGTGANFNATSANTNNTIKAGIVNLGTTSEDEAVLEVTKLVPGDSESETVDVTNTGDLPATFELSASGLVDTPASPALSSRLDLKVEDTGDPTCSSSCPATKTVYSGKLGAFTTATVGSWAPNVKHRVRLTVTLPEGGAAVDDDYQDARSRVGLTWTARG